jgi:hypothetical protein
VRLEGWGKLKIKITHFIGSRNKKKMVSYSTEFYQNPSNGLVNATCRTMVRLTCTTSITVDVIATKKDYNIINKIKSLLRHLFIKYKGYKYTWPCFKCLFSLFNINTSASSYQHREYNKPTQCCSCVTYKAIYCRTPVNIIVLTTHS